ncbi:signal peptidase I [Cellulomonas bogoriensis]|uniref:Signal peptidase I n=1 Tax=Cellulomonas bogoriensis 69B4 = DSM 16987 TaxID=1386082 RepID=A0A0A0BMT8_9CELL|nr:signal peptidase I [Cellulomonas bogoriensis]KGM08384.1 peptidase S26B, signal peptidase [Cellulomonas bogoriensis 69B4 = DSM 16987]
MTRQHRATDAGTSRRLLGAAGTAAWVALVAVAVTLLWPTSLGGCTTLTIVSGRSMEPTYSSGDLVVARCGAAQVGDVIVYRPPGVDGARVIHRVVGGDAQGWVVQGDNNDFLDPWRPAADRVDGVAAVHLPHLGRVASLLIDPVTWVSVMLLALAVVVWPGRSDAPRATEGER